MLGARVRRKEPPLQIATFMHQCGFKKDEVLEMLSNEDVDPALIQTILDLQQCSSAPHPRERVLVMAAAFASAVLTYVILNHTPSEPEDIHNRPVAIAPQSPHLR